jgi:hypothetical protein
VIRLRRRPISKLAVAVAATLGTLLACEVASRILLSAPRYHREPVAFDPLFGFRGIPGHRQQGFDERGRYVVALNSQGFRGRELPAEPARASDGMLRIVFVGDSFLIGSAVREEQLVTSLVEAGLRSRGREAEVFNLSGVDWGTAQEILALRELGRPLAPDAVVLFVYPANDWINNSMLLAGRSTVSAGDPIRPYLVREEGELRVRYLDPLRAVVRRHSRLFATLERRVLAKTAGGVSAEDSAGRLLRGGAPREDLEIFRTHADPRDRWERAWGTSFELLRAFRDECAELGARLLVVVVPSVHQVVAAAKSIRLDIEARTARGQPLSEILDWELPERRLADFFAAEGIEARLLLGPLREGARQGDRIYSGDEHLAPRGHELAAGPVVDWILSARSPAVEPRELAPGPVALLPDASIAPAWLDFSRDRHRDFLGDGWIGWAAAASGGVGGWRMGPAALAVLPLREGALVIRGWVPPTARLPIHGRLQVFGGPEGRFRVDRPGRFARRFFFEPRQGGRWPSSGGFVALLLATTDAGGGGGDSGALWVEGLGYETPGTDRAARD